MTNLERKLLCWVARLASKSQGQEGHQILETVERVEYESLFLEDDIPRYTDGTIIEGVKGRDDE